MDYYSQQLPKALVLRWNSRKVIVKCPFCLYSHGHGFCHPSEDDIDEVPPGYEIHRPKNQRRSDCSDRRIGGQYLIVYPDERDSVTSGYGWEVDTEACEFVTADQQGIVAVPVEDYQDGRTLLLRYQRRYSESETGELAPIMDGLNFEDDAKEQGPRSMSDKTIDEVLEELHLDPKWRQKQYFSHAIRKEIQGLKNLRRRYPDDRLIGSVDHEGNTAALFAAIEENGSETLHWLQNQGDPIQQANHYGRTPLMEAALWGRLDTVRYLSQQDINFKARDGNGMQAVDLAADTPRNRKERTVRSGAGYREHPQAGRDREQIQALLSRLTSPVSKRTRTEKEIQRRTFFERRDDGKIEIYRPQVLLQPPSGTYGHQKAFATLDRGSNYPFVDVMSGYSHHCWPNVLDNTVWTKKAEKMRVLLGLSRDKVAASHVESQLLAYLLDRHSLIMLEDEDGREELRSAMPVYSLRPIITVSKPDLCDKCLDLFERFKNTFPGFGVTFHCVGDSAVTPPVIQQ